MEAKEVNAPKFKVYDCMFHHGGNLLHSMPLTGITREELKLMVFIHGRDAVPPSSVKFAGERHIFMRVRSTEGERIGQEVDVAVQNVQDEYKRLAKKYEVLSDLDGVGRGRRYVEECFKVRLDDIEDSMFTEVDPIAAIEEAAARSELAKAVVREEKTEKPDDAASGGGAAPSMSSAFSRAGRGSEGVRP